MEKLNGRTALVTGAAGGIGIALTEVFAAGGDIEDASGLAERIV